MFRETTFLTRAAWMSVMISGVLAVAVFSGCQNARSCCGATVMHHSPYVAACGNGCQCGRGQRAGEMSAAEDTTKENAPACTPAYRQAPQPSAPSHPKAVRWPAGTAGTISGCNESCGSTADTSAYAPPCAQGCGKAPAGFGFFAKKPYCAACNTAPRPFCAACSGPKNCAACQYHPGSPIPASGNGAGFCPHCQYNAAGQPAPANPPSDADGCDVSSQRNASALNSVVETPETSEPWDATFPSPTGTQAPVAGGDSEVNTLLPPTSAAGKKAGNNGAALEPVFPGTNAMAAPKTSTERKTPAPKKKTEKKTVIAPGPKIIETPDSLPLAPPLEIGEEGVFSPLPPMKEVLIPEEEPGTLLVPEFPDMPGFEGPVIREFQDLPGGLDMNILPMDDAESEDDMDFILELPEDNRPDKPFTESVEAKRKREAEKKMAQDAQKSRSVLPPQEKRATRQQEYPSVSEKEPKVPLSQRSTQKTPARTVVPPVSEISVCTFHHPLNDVKEAKNVKTEKDVKPSRNTVKPPRQDYMVRQTAMQVPVEDSEETAPAARETLDAAALADAALRGERAAEEARKKDFSNIPAPQRKHNAYPEDEYIIDTTQQARIKELKSRRVGDGETADDDWRVSAHDGEGTIIHFSTPGGRSAIQTTDPVYIYSPRFRAVRQVVDPTLSGQVTKIGDVNTPTVVNAQQRTVGAERTTQQKQAITETGRDQAVKMAGTQYGGEISDGLALRSSEQNRTIPQVAKVENTLSHYDMSTSPRVQNATIGAFVWTSTEQMIVFVDHQRAAASIGTQNAPSLYVVEEKKEKPQVKIYKVASKDSAKSGETVTFTIRFENSGNSPITNIVVADNLPARLALDPASPESSVEVDFSYEPNANGSSLLRWEVMEPLQPGDWGVVRFNCLVR